MKDLITAIAAVSIMMIFVLQFSVNQAIISKITAADRTVDSYRLTVQEKGEPDDRERLELMENISRILGCEKNEVVITEEENRYEVRAPIKNVVACGRLLGISQDENKADYVVSGEKP